MKKKPSQKSETVGNKYDRIFRENIESIFLPLIERHLNITIKYKEPLPEKIVSTVEREVDTLYKIETTKGKKFLLHWETQTKNDKNMVYRVGEYHALDLAKYRLPILHVVLYLGSASPSMKTTLPEKEIYTGFELLSVRDMNVKQLLASNVPEEVLLAILADYDREDSSDVIHSILLKLEALCKGDKRIKKYTNQLTILSKLRNLEVETVTKIKDMPQLFDIRSSILFKEGHEEGHQEGHEEGHQEGHQEGLEKGLTKGVKRTQLIMVANMLTETDLSIEQIADLADLDVTFILYVKENLETQKWEHPDAWTEEQWETYFEE